MIATGQCVQISENEAGIVLEAATLIGGEPVYKVLRAFDDAEDGEVTYVVDAPSVLPGSRLCTECPLWYEGRCGLSQLDLAA